MTYLDKVRLKSKCSHAFALSGDEVGQSLARIPRITLMHGAMAVRRYPACVAELSEVGTVVE